MRVAIFTFTRAEYSYLRNAIKRLVSADGIEADVFVGGMHLASSYGYTANEVRKDIEDFYHLSFLLDGDTPGMFSKSVGVGITSLASVMENQKVPYDYVIILGDRYELYIATVVAMLWRIPIIHISGGERTEGLIDEQVRHSITKMAHIHIVSTETYAENVSRMGEEDWRIHILGAASIENIYTTPLMPLEEILESTGVDMSKPTLMVTYHPVTLDIDTPPDVQVKNLINALSRFPFQVVFTSPGAETGRNAIVEVMKDAVRRREGWYFFTSLGYRRYLSMVKHSIGVVGNSSSGIIEVPSLGVPTLNIGDRQKGRVAAESVVHVGYGEKEIVGGIRKITSDDFRKRINVIFNPYDPYGDGRFSDRFLEIIRRLPTDTGGKKRMLRKQLDFNVKRECWNYYLKGGEDCEVV